MGDTCVGAFYDFHANLHRQNLEVNPERTGRYSPLIASSLKFEPFSQALSVRERLDPQKPNEIFKAKVEKGKKKIKKLKL